MGCILVTQTVKRFFDRSALRWIISFGVSLFFLSSVLNATGVDAISPDGKYAESINGSWTFSGLVNSENGDKYGYFFEMQRQGVEFQTKAALIDSQTNQLVFYYEANESIKQTEPLNWRVGKSFLRFNPINDSWIFGVRKKDKQGFNFKVDMMKQDKVNAQETLVLRPGVKLQALQTSQLNGHIQLADREQFVTASRAWFGKLELSGEQKKAHDISTTFCRLSDENGFYSANLKEKDATSAAVAGWLDPTGNRVKMSQFVSVKTFDKDQCEVRVGLPKLNIKLLNTLKSDTAHVIAGFARENKGAFCFVTEQLFKEQIIV